MPDMYEFQYGQGIARDSERAVSYYEKGCKLGDTVSCYAVAVMLRAGTGIERNIERAAKLFEFSCKNDWGGQTYRLQFVAPDGNRAI